MVWVEISILWHCKAAGPTVLPSSLLAWSEGLLSLLPPGHPPHPGSPDCTTLRAFSHPLWARGCFSLDEESCLPLAPFQHSRVFFFLSFFFFLIFIYFFYFWLCWVFAAAHGLSSGCGERGLLFVVVHGLLMQWLLLLRSTGSRRIGFSSCGTWAQ